MKRTDKFRIHLRPIVIRADNEEEVVEQFINGDYNDKIEIDYVLQVFK